MKLQQEIQQRIDNLRKLKDGWLNGYGRAPLPDGLDWFESVFLANCSDEIPVPEILPTIFGAIQVEWSIGSFQVAMGVSFKSKQGHWRASDTSIGFYQEMDFDLTNPNAWKTIERNLHALKSDNVFR